MICYFSGTGNSLWTARELGRTLGEPVENLTKFLDRPLDCIDKLIGFVCPVYVNDLPPVVKTVLAHTTFHEDSYIFLVTTSNHGKIGFSGKSMGMAVEKAGAKLSAVFSLQMPGNAMVSSPEENEERLKAAPEQVKNIAECIRERQCNYSLSRTGFLERMMMSKPMGEKNLVDRMNKFTVRPECNGCGICASVCPLKNISIENGKPIHGNTCACCLACVHWCPKHATVVDYDMLRDRPQYTHPDVSLKDMTESGSKNKWRS